MSSFIVWAVLILSVLIGISAFLSMKNKNTDSYQAVLCILVLLAFRTTLYALEIISFSNHILSYLFFLMKLSLLPVIASFFLMFAMSSVRFVKHIKQDRKILSLISFFFVGVILTNPIHNLAFTLTGNNTIFELGYNEGTLLHISDIYSGMCILAGFIIIAMAIFSNTIKQNKMLSFLGGLLALISYILLYTEASFDIEGLIAFISMLVLYAFVFRNNDYNIVPTIRDNTFELINDGVVVVNSEYIIKDYNKTIVKLFTDIDFTNVIGRKIEEVFKFYPVVIYAVKNYKSENIFLNGKGYAIELYSSIEKNKKSTLHTISFKDSASIAASLNKLNERTTIDYLTQVKNKDYFLDLISFEFNKSVRYGLPFVLLYLDIDDFTKINNEYGHIAGDLVLANVASIIQKEIRKTDVLARIEEDLFALLLTNTNSNSCMLVAERIKEKVASNVLCYEGKTIKTTISIGISGNDVPSDSSVDTYIQKANEAVEKAKASNKNCVVVNLSK